MQSNFIAIEGHLINISQIASASDTDSGVHINMIGGGFFDIPDLSVEGLGALVNGAAF